MTRSTRRAFFRTTTGAAVGAWLGGQTAFALPISYWRMRGAAQTYCPDLLEPPTLSALAATAVEAARGAGAGYADVRVADMQILNVSPDLGNPLSSQVSLATQFAYGIRVQVDGAWTFAHGIKPDHDAIAMTARDAVATAIGYARVMKQPVVFSPAPAVTGQWLSPMQIDPFVVPIEDQTALRYACEQAAGRVLGGGLTMQFAWIRETRVFASSEGALVTQRFRRSMPRAQIFGNRYRGQVGITLPRFGAGIGGYETVLTPDIQQQVYATAEEAVRLSQLPERTIDVGRYPVVLSGDACAAVLGATLGPALELDRVIGDETNGAGSSFLTPDLLGTPIFSPNLTMTASRAAPTFGAARWDDEGVETHSYPVMTNGAVVDYHTTRQTSPVLKSWYDQRRAPVQSHGCAVASTAGQPVLARAPHVTIAPAGARVTEQDLYHDIQHGLLIHQAPFVSTDQQLASGNLSYGLPLEINRGKIVGRVKNAGIQFHTRSLWKGLAQLGDASTVRTSETSLNKGEPWQSAFQSATAPAALFNDVPVITIGRSR